MGSPVCGLRPTRALRCAFTRRPMPGTTNTPFFLVSLMAVSARCSRNADAVLLFSSVFSARWRTSWVLVKPAAMNPPLLKGWVLCWDAELILIPAPVEKQQNRRILRGFSHSGTKNGHKNSGFTRYGRLSSLRQWQKILERPGRLCPLARTNATWLCSGIGAKNMAFLDGIS